MYERGFFPFRSGEANIQSIAAVYALRSLGAFSTSSSRASSDSGLADLHDQRTTQGQFSAQPVDILPLQSGQLRPSQTQTHAHNRHCAIRLRENAAQTMELFDPLRASLSSRLGSILDTHKLHWVAVHRDQLHPHTQRVGTKPVAALSIHYVGN